MFAADLALVRPSIVCGLRAHFYRRARAAAMGGCAALAPQRDAPQLAPQTRGRLISQIVRGMVAHFEDACCKMCRIIVFEIGVVNCFSCKSFCAMCSACSCGALVRCTKLLTTATTSSCRGSVSHPKMLKAALAPGCLISAGKSLRNSPAREAPCTLVF